MLCVRIMRRLLLLLVVLGGLLHARLVGLVLRVGVVVAVLRSRYTTIEAVRVSDLIRGRSKAY